MPAPPPPCHGSRTPEQFEALPWKEKLTALEPCTKLDETPLPRRSHTLLNAWFTEHYKEMIYRAFIPSTLVVSMFFECHESFRARRLQGKLGPELWDILHVSRAHRAQRSGVGFADLLYTSRLVHILGACYTIRAFSVIATVREQKTTGDCFPPTFEINSCFYQTRSVTHIMCDE